MSPYQSISTFVLGARKNRLTETILLSIHSMFLFINMKAKFQLLNLLCLKMGKFSHLPILTPALGAQKNALMEMTPQTPTPYVFMHKFT